MIPRGVPPEKSRLSDSFAGFNTRFQFRSRVAQHRKDLFASILLIAFFGRATGRFSC